MNATSTSATDVVDLEETVEEALEAPLPKREVAADTAATERIPFNRAWATGGEVDLIRQAIENGHLSADGPFTRKCRRWFEERTGAAAALLVTSCTAALEMSVTLAGVGPGDEVIVPSFTFSSSANAIVLRGATPVFVDIREDTLNLDENEVEDAVTGRTKAIMPVHYAGVGCDMAALGDIAGRHSLRIIEDAAQGLLSTWNDRPLGAIGDLGAISFHETKNVTCGEGGVLLVNDPALIERAEILREKGTDRSRFFRGEVDKYTWHDAGSSYALSDLNAAFLASQLSKARQTTERRLEIWQRYHDAFADLEQGGRLRRPIVPGDCVHNAHMYYILLNDEAARDSVMVKLNARAINAVFHYVPLHSAPAGVTYGRNHGSLERTDNLSGRLLRLPLWPGLSDVHIERIVSATRTAVEAQ